MPMPVLGLNYDFVRNSIQRLIAITRLAYTEVLALLVANASGYNLERWS